MGRPEIEIKLIEKKSFCKRRRSLLKKTRELAILCDMAPGVVSRGMQLYGGGLCNGANASVDPCQLSIEDLNCTCKTNTVNVENFCTLDRLIRDSKNLQRDLRIRDGNVEDLKRFSNEELSAVEVKMGRALQNIKIHRTYKELELLKKKQKQLEMENDELRRQIEAVEYGSSPDAALHGRELYNTSSDDDTANSVHMSLLQLRLTSC